MADDRLTNSDAGAGRAVRAACACASVKSNDQRAQRRRRPRTKSREKSGRVEMRGKPRAMPRSRGKEHSFDEAMWKRNEGGLLEETVRGIVRSCSMPGSKTISNGAPVAVAVAAQFPCMNCRHIVMDRELCPKCGTKTTAESAAILQLMSKSSSSSVRNGLAVPLSDKACKVEMVIQNPDVAMALQEVVNTDLDAEEAGQTAANSAYRAAAARAKAVDARQKAELLLVSLMNPNEAEGGKVKSTGSERRSSSSLLLDKENLLSRMPLRQRRTRPEGAGTNKMHDALAKKAVEIVLLKAKLARMRSTAACAESRAGLVNVAERADPALKPAPAADGEVPSSPVAAGKAASPPRRGPHSPPRPVPYDEATLSCNSPCYHASAAADFTRSLETSSAAHDESEDAPREDGPLALLSRLNAVSSSHVPFDSDDEDDAVAEIRGLGKERVVPKDVGTAAHDAGGEQTEAPVTPDAASSPAASSVALRISSDVAELLSDETLACGVALEDVAARRRVVVHSLDELRQGRAYNTLRGNCLRRTARCTCSSCLPLTCESRTHSVHLNMRAHSTDQPSPIHRCPLVQLSTAPWLSLCSDARALFCSTQ
eukprot:6205402-Pleurochrysis_carterae.AAC.1